MQAGANILDAAIFEPITVNIEFGYGEYGLNTASYETLPGGISLGGIESDVEASYPALKAALTSNETSAVGAAAVSQLPNTASLGGYANFAISTALAKAFGAPPATAAAIDGQVGFPSDFTGSVLVGAAIVEEGHALGLLYSGATSACFPIPVPATTISAAAGPPPISRSTAA